MNKENCALKLVDEIIHAGWLKFNIYCIVVIRLFILTSRVLFMFAQCINSIKALFYYSN